MTTTAPLKFVAGTGLQEMTTTEIDAYITKRVAMEFAMGSINQLQSIALNGTSQYLTIGLDPQFATQPATALNTVNPTTAVNSTTDLITVSAHGLVNNDIVTYVSSGGNTVISGLANNASYFVVQANGTVFGLSNTLGGSLINLTAGAIIETGHAFKRQFTESLPRASQDFTIEGWIYLNAHTAATPCVFSTNSLAAGAAIGPGSLAFYAGNASLAGGSTTTWSVVINNSTIINGTTAITNQLWHHFAIVRSGSTITLYINGVVNGTATYAGPIVSPFRTLILGTDGGALTTSYIDGYIHRFRIVVGEAVYTSAFTAGNLSPLSHFNNTTLHIGAQRTHYNSLNILDYGVLNNPVTPVGLNSAAVSASQTQLLLTTPANSSFLVDTSTNAYVATNNGGAVSNTSNPFVVSTPGSIQLSGSSQYITYAVSNTTMSVAVSTPFTIEFWINANATQVQAAGAPCIFSTTNNGGNSGHMAFFVGHTGFNASKQYCLYWVGMTAGIGGEKTATNLLTSTGTYIAGQWTHIAIVRSGTSAVTMYVNGRPNATTTWTGGIGFNGGVFYLGTSGDNLSGSSFTGNIANFRFVNGAAVYNGIFNPPIAPLQTSQVATTTTPSVSAVNPYNVGSISFNGSSQYLSAPSNSGFAFGTGNFTLEAWIYVAGGASNRTIVSTRPTSAGYTTAGSLGVDSGGGVYWYTNGYTAQNTSSQGFTSAWNHVAVVRNGSGANNLKIYVNGTSVITATDSTNYTAQVLSIGGNNDGSELFNGNITCVRVVTGTAAYTADFNRSVSVPSDITNTKLLMYVRNNTDWLVDDASGLTITATGSPVYSQTPFCPVSTKSNVGTLGVGMMDYGTSIGSWVDTWYPQDSFFTAATNQTTTVYQDLTTAPAVGFANRPLGWNSALPGLQQMPDTDIDTRISSRVVSYMTSGQGIGSYWLGAARPTIGGNWVQRATFTNTLNPTVVNTAIEQATITFNTSSGINADTDTITTATHRFNNNDIVTYTCSTGNTCAAGLANGASYYIVNTVSGGTTLQLSSTIGGTPINIFGTPAETGHTLTLSSNTFLWQKVSESPGSGMFAALNGFQINPVPYIGIRSWTLEFWLQITLMPQGTWYLWVTTPQGSGSTNFPTLSFATGVRTFGYGAVGAPFTTLGSINSGIYDGNWHHIATVYRGTTYSITFNALTGVANTTEYITTTSAHSFVNNDAVYYTVYAGNTAIGGLTANSGPYYVINANTTALQLSTTVGGAAINLTAGLNQTGHVLAKETYLPNTAFVFVDGILANSAAGNFNPGLNTTSAVHPGAGGNSSTPPPSGKIAHIRLTSGGLADALYTSNFTPPKGPITATANTRVYAACLSEATMNVNSSPITVVTASFNALSGVNSTTDFVTTLSAHGLANGDQVVYGVATGNTAITGLTANQSYYVINSNTTALQLSTTFGGANVNITAGLVSETGHTLTRGSTITTNSIAWSPMNPYTEAGVYGFTSNTIPVIYSPTGGPIKRALEDDIRTIVNQTRNYIVSSGIGTYALSATAPTPGTWVAVGPGIIDTKRKVGTYTPPSYASLFTGAFTRIYTGGVGGVYILGPYTKGYTGDSYRAQFANVYTSGPYSFPYTGITTAKELGIFTAQPRVYTAVYTSAGVPYNTYSATYTPFTRIWTTTTLTYTLTTVVTAVYSGQWTGGQYTRLFTLGGLYGTFTGRSWTGSFIPVYNALYTRGPFTGEYTGAPFNQAFTKLYTVGGLSLIYTANQTLPAVETVQTIKLWVRTA